MRDAVGDAMGLTLRVSLDETIGALGFSNAELRDFIELNRDLPDLWDLARGTWEDCSGPSRFKGEAAQEVLVSRARQVADIEKTRDRRCRHQGDVTSDATAQQSRVHRDPGGSY